VIAMLGLQEAGSTAVLVPCRLVPCEPEVGLFQATAPECPAKVTGIPVADAAVPKLPAGPVGPLGPAAPVAPVLPVAPVGPLGPAAPVAPVLPVAPVGPLGPAAPVAPAGPTSDWQLPGQAPDAFGPYRQVVVVSR
jgi:hypothetical protein